MPKANDVYADPLRSQNLEYARTLLLRLERSAARRPRAKSTVTATSNAPRAELAPQRARLKRLHDRLYELGQRYDDADDVSSESNGEDILATYCAPVPPPADTSPSSPGRSDPSPPSPTAERGTASPVTTSTGIRSRFPHAPPNATTTGSAYPAVTSPASPAPPPSAKEPPAAAASPTTAAALDAHASTQSDLTSSLLTLAAALKDSARAFNADLAADSATLAATEGALGKSREGMDAATRRMGVLRRMSEGRWWWGRMALYAAIAGLWVVALLLVFVGPKLRF